MQYGICLLSVVPVRPDKESSSALITQLLYGEHYKILEEQKKYSKIRVAYDGTEGWVLNMQITKIEEAKYTSIEKQKSLKHTEDILAHICTDTQNLLPIIIGSQLNTIEQFGHSFEGEYIAKKQPKEKLVHTALLYLNSPFQIGGKTPFGIDAPGFTQMVYKINGYALGRSAEQQSKQGEALSFIEESQPGDLAFFDNHEGVIDHVGLILPNNHIIHAHGKVRIDRIDHTGIFNSEERLYSHKLRVIKKIY